MPGATPPGVSSLISVMAGAPNVHASTALATAAVVSPSAVGPPHAASSGKHAAPINTVIKWLSIVFIGPSLAWQTPEERQRPLRVPSGRGFPPRPGNCRVHPMDRGASRADQPRLSAVRGGAGLRPGGVAGMVGTGLSE